MDDDRLREALIAKAASELARLVTWTRAERAVRGDDAKHAAWLDEMIAGLEPVAKGIGDVETSMAMRRVVQQHGGAGPADPWTVEDFAAMTGRDVESVRRVMAGWTAAGLAWPLAPPDDGDDSY